MMGAEGLFRFQLECVAPADFQIDQAGFHIGVDFAAAQRQDDGFFIVKSIDGLGAIV
jgi:hypothetical protein